MFFKLSGTTHSTLTIDVNAVSIHPSAQVSVEVEKQIFGKEFVIWNSCGDARYVSSPPPPLVMSDAERRRDYPWLASGPSKWDDDPDPGATPAEARPGAVAAATPADSEAAEWPEITADEEAALEHFLGSLALPLGFG